jgi:uncharacterized membrane protein
VSIPTYLPVSVLAGCIGTIAAVIVGLNQGLKRASWQAGERRSIVRTMAVVLVGWFALALALAILGVYQPNSDQLPTIEFGIITPILIGGLFIWRSSTISRLIDAIPRHWVIAVQLYRAEGVTFLILYASKLLPGLFALPAGAGDIAIGLTGLIIGINAARRGQLLARTVLRWNLFGIADLIIALATGVLTSPSPLQRFAFDRPNQLIATFPLVLIPTFLVPLAILLHIISLTQLRRAGVRRREAAGTRAHEPGATAA